MKKILLAFLFGFILASCTDQKAESQEETHQVAESIEDILENLGELKTGTLKIIDSHQEITLKQVGDKCGEWGGDTKQIRIYKTDYKGQVFVDYRSIIIKCNERYFKDKEPKVVEKNGLVMNESDLELAQESIAELLYYKMSTEIRISHAGIGNYVISQDSTLIIQDWPSFDWPKFRELIEQIENK